jgi:hypothetical protein
MVRIARIFAPSGGLIVKDLVSYCIMCLQSHPGSFQGLVSAHYNIPANFNPRAIKS